MRELYRGIDKNGKWVYGGIYETYETKNDVAVTYIVVKEARVDRGYLVPVDKKSVGKYLMDDKFGDPIFSGDLVEVDGYDGVFEITYAASEAQYELSNLEEDYILTFDNVWNYDCTVVGNKYTQKTEDFVYEQD